MVNQFIWWNGEMVNFPQWGYIKMSKCNGIIFLPLTTPFYPLINVRTGSEWGCPHQFLLHFFPSHSLQIDVPIPIPLLHLHFFSHIRLKLHPSICLLLSPFFYTNSLSIRLPITNDLFTPLNLHLYLHTLPLPLPLFLPIPLHYYQLHFPSYHLYPNHRSQIIQRQWIDALIPLLMSHCY